MRGIGAPASSAEYGPQHTWSRGDELERCWIDVGVDSRSMCMQHAQPPPLIFDHPLALIQTRSRRAWQRYERRGMTETLTSLMQRSVALTVTWPCFLSFFSCSFLYLVFPSHLRPKHQTEASEAAPTGILAQPIPQQQATPVQDVAVHERWCVGGRNGNATTVLCPQAHPSPTLSPAGNAGAKTRCPTACATSVRGRCRSSSTLCPSTPCRSSRPRKLPAVARCGARPAALDASRTLRAATPRGEFAGALTGPLSNVCWQLPHNRLTILPLPRHTVRTRWT